MNYDCVIIGAGVVGSSIARELSRYDLKVLVLEKASDVCEGTSKANSGIVHAGFDAHPGTKKAYFNVLGSKKMEALSQELDFPYKRNGSIVLCFDEKEIPKLEELKARGEKNGVVGITILNREKLFEKEPNINKNAVAALFAPTGAIVCPFGLTIAMAENAAENGVEFKFNEEVKDIKKVTDSGIEGVGTGFEIKTAGNTYHTKTIINAAGVFADTFHNMLCPEKIKITARKGEYQLFDKKVGSTVSSTVFRLPGPLGKGVLVTPTVHGNLLIGPTALDTEDKEDVATTAEGLSTVTEKASESIVSVPGKFVITSFAGLRAHSDVGDFLIGKSAEGFYEAAGIESPGLTAAPAIGEYLAKMIAFDLGAVKKPDFKAKRTGIKSMALATTEEKEELIRKNPLYGNVICRCELVTEGEIVDAIKRPLGATTVDGVKRRVRAGMGRCQAGFCLPKTIDILARELHVDVNDIRKKNAESIYTYPHKEKAD